MFKKIKKIILLLLIISPFNVLAYSDYIIASGKSVGIKINTEGVIIAGSYKINNIDNLKESKLQVGDIVTKINDIKINNIDEMIEKINDCNCENVKIEYKRKNKTGYI